MSWPWHPAGHCHSPCSPVPRAEGSISTSLHEWSRDTQSCQHHHHWLVRRHKGSSSPLTSILATLWDPHHWRWPLPPWRSPHCSSFRKGESTATMHQLHQGITKAQLLTHGCIFWPGINKAIEEVVHQRPGFKPRMLQHPSHLHQLHPAHGRCAPQTSLPWKESTTSYVETSTQRWSLSGIFHLARATPSKSSRCSR